MKTPIIYLLVILTVSVLQVKSQNMLRDGDFESSKPLGNWPSSGAWKQSWYPYDAGAVTTTTAAKNGVSGLWIYTSTLNSFCRPHQETVCVPLTKYKAEAWLRSPWNQSWTQGTEAYIRISFLSKTGRILQSVSSDTLLTGNTGWEKYSVIATAPENAAKVRFEITLESLNGQSIVNVDNCFLSDL